MLVQKKLGQKHISSPKKNFGSEKNQGFKKNCGLKKIWL